MKRSLALAIANLLLVLPLATRAADFLVINASDSGAGSLRQALEDAGATPDGAHNIGFGIPGAGPHVIAPLSPLPTPDQPVVIDGYTQPGATHNTATSAFNGIIKIRLDGGGFGVDGLRLRQPGNVVRGLAFIRWTGNGVDIAEGGSNRVAGCLFGIDVDGSNKANTGPAILVTSSDNELGGLNPADRNVISYNTFGGIALSGSGASSNLVRGNFIGTDFSGTIRNANALDGVGIYDAPYNVVGGTEPGARNLISGNFLGVHLQSPGAVGNLVQGNLIGTDIHGTNRVFNNTDGVRITGGVSNLVGGANAAARNIVSGNSGNGIGLFSGAAANRVLGNWIGVGATGGALSNNNSGLNIEGNSNQIGGIALNEGNVIANSTGSGVRVHPNSAGNAIRGNQIYGTVPQFVGASALGIDLSGDGVSANDPGDGDPGPNNYQNFPIITNAIGDVSSVTVQGVLDSGTNQSYQLDFYANITCNTSGNGEGRFYLGSTPVNTDGNGQAMFSATFSGTAPGPVVTATATDADGNTSEFSACHAVTFNIPPQTFKVINTNDSGAGSLRQALLDSNNHLASSNNTIAFDIPGTGMRVIKLLTMLPPFTQPVTIDGFTQTNSSPNTLSEGSDAIWLVELNGSLAAPAFTADGLHFNIPNLVVRGLRIVGFGRDGLVLGPGASNCVIAGNCIITNGNAGVNLSNAVANRVGGSLPADRNLIFGNPSYGVYLQGGDCRNNTIHGNLIGTDASGSQPFGASQFQGVSLVDASNNNIGGTNSGQANLIAFNSSGGITVNQGTNNAVRGNRIFGNGGRGIALTGLFGNGDVNDADDSDSGGNDLQNFPVLSNATANAGSTLISGSLTSRPNQAYSLDFYTSESACGFFGGQGEFYLGSSEVTTDGSGSVNFNVLVPATVQRPYLLATATDTNGNTSQFSECIEPLFNLPGLTYQVTNTNDSGPGSLRQAILDTGVSPNSTPDRIHFNILGPGVKIIRPLTPLPELPTAVIIDGYTQPGATANTLSNADNAVLLIQLDGSLTSGTAFSLVHSGNTIRGLSITGFDHAFALNAGTNVVEGNWIGVAPAGAAAGNHVEAILVSSAGNLIGGTTPAARNLISGNGREAVFVSGAAAKDNVIQGNFIGVGVTGTNALPNGRDGIEINQARNNLIGGSAPGAGNVISANTEYGVRITGALAFSNRLEGNFIGTSFSRTNLFASTNLFFPFGFGNQSSGVLITSGASTNTIGGTPNLTDNAICFNGGDGVWVESGRQNGIIGNMIFGNVGKPIHLSPGANDDVKPAVIDYAVTGSTSVKVRLVGAKTNTTYKIEIRAEIQHPSLDLPWDALSLQTAGRTQDEHLGFVSTTTDANGNVEATLTVPAIYNPRSKTEENDDDYTTFYARVNCDNSTSEQSGSVPLSKPHEVNLEEELTATSPVPAGTHAAVTLTLKNKGPANATNVVAKQVLPPGGTVVNTTPPPGGTSMPSDGVIDFFFGSIDIGQSKTAVATIAMDVIGLVETWVEAIAVGQVDTVPEDNIAKAPIEVISTSLLPCDVTVSVVHANAMVPHGSPDQATVLVTNRGPAPAVGVYAAITIPPVSTGLSNSASQGTITELMVFPSRLFWNLPLLLPGASATISVHFVSDFDQIRAGRTEEVQARVSTASPEFSYVNNLASASFTVLPPGLEASPATGGKVEVSFPLTAANTFQLQSTPSLTPPIIWTTVPQTSLVTNSTNLVLSFTPPNAAGYFRLAPTEMPRAASVELFQPAINLNGGIFYLASAWGEAEFEIQPGGFQPGSFDYSNAYYLNLSVGCDPVGLIGPRGGEVTAAGGGEDDCPTNWPVRNLPIFPRGEDPLAYMVTNPPLRFSVFFPLLTGTNSGRLVYLTNYGVSLTTNVLIQPPPTTNLAPVRFSTLGLYGMSTGGPVLMRPLPLIGTNVVFTNAVVFTNGMFQTNRIYSSARHRSFSGMNHGIRENVPAAFASSLTHLEVEFNLGLGTNIFIETMKLATGWTPDGGSFSGPWSEFNPQTANWIQGKIAYMDEKNLPIATEVTTNLSLAMAAIRNKYDVEVWFEEEVACVVEITEMAGGRWQLWLVGDLNPGAPGGLRRYPVIYDPATGDVTGALHLRKFKSFVIERPEF